jgi:tetratricopeptide (TPR) repeat protein
MSTASTVMTWPSLLCFYLRLLVYPVGLSEFYDVPYVTAPTLSGFILPALAILVVATGLWMWARRSGSPAVGFAVAWLVLPILPLLYIPAFTKGDIAHDRYLYLPSVGFVMLIALALRRMRLGTAKLMGAPAAQVACASALAIAFSMGTAVQELYWANEMLLYRRGVAISPQSALVRNNLANVLLDRGEMDEAVRLYQQVLQHDPEYWRANFNLGYAFFRAGRLQDAEHYFQRAIQQNPRDADEYAYMGMTYLKQGRPAEAEAQLRTAIQLQPQGEGYHLGLGLALELQRKPAAAAEEYKRELAMHPQNQHARARLNQVQAQ